MNLYELKKYLLILPACFAGLSVNAQTDTSSIAIIELDTNQHWSWHLKPNHPYRLNQEQVKEVDHILSLCIAQNNNGGVKDNSFGIYIGIHSFIKQLVASVNLQGEVIVWVNCFCKDFITNESDHAPFMIDQGDNWKKKILQVNDGGVGGCFFNVEINLTTKTYTKLYVNGL